VDSEFESLGLTEKEYVSLWFSICGEGRPVKPVASADKHFNQHSNKLWIHACSIDFDSLHLRLQNYAHRLGLPFDERLTEALIHYRLSKRPYASKTCLKSFAAILSVTKLLPGAGDTVSLIDDEDSDQ
tara:strand:- start:92 stop:475 length:384 start_codon:yes stop_codon:yes gene_type:complete